MPTTGSKPQSPLDRFWRFVGPPTETGCWPWLGPRIPRGYGTFLVRPHHGRSVNVYAHRFSWTLHNGLDTPPGSTVMHACDNPWCVNPSHLSLGTASANMIDAVRKGRHSAGRLLTERDVWTIRGLLAFGVVARKIGLVYGVAESTIYNIKRGTRYANLTNAP